MPVVIDSTSKTDISCFGAKDGSITVSVSVGAPPYLYSLDNGATFQASNIFTNLLPGSYTVLVRDCDCDESTDGPIDITEPPQLLVDCSVTHVTCFGFADGAATATASGGTPPYIYDWETGVLPTPSPCPAHCISPPPSPCPSPTNSLIPPPCPSPIAVGCDLVGVPAGNYLVHVTDASGCTVCKEIEITEPAELLIEVIKKDITCNGDCDGMITINAIGGTPPYMYSIDGGACFQTNNIYERLLADCYDIVVKDANDCEVTQTGYCIVEPPVLSVVVDKTDITCFGENDGSVTAVASGGVPPHGYEWTDISDMIVGATDTVDNLGPGFYICTVTDDNGCKTHDHLEVVEPDPVQVDVEIKNVACIDDGVAQITVTPKGGVPDYTVSVSGQMKIGVGPFDFGGILPATHTLTVVDSKGCMVVERVEIIEPVPMEIECVITDATCFTKADGKINITVSGGDAPYTYAWSDGSTAQDRTDMPAGVYTLEVTDSLGCKADKEVEVKEPDPLEAMVEVAPASCKCGSDGEAHVTVIGGVAPYLVTMAGQEHMGNGPFTFKDLKATTYTLTVFDKNLCVEQKIVTVTEPEELTVLPIVTGVTCHDKCDASIDANPSGGMPPYEYEWNDGSTEGPERDGLCPGEYTVTITDKNFCQAKATATVVKPAELRMSVNVQHPSCSCYDLGTMTITAVGGSGIYQYSIDGINYYDSGVFPDLECATYLPTVRDSNGCIVQKSMELRYKPDIHTYEDYRPW